MRKKKLLLLKEAAMSLQKAYRILGLSFGDHRNLDKKYQDKLDDLNDAKEKVEGDSMGDTDLQDMFGRKRKR